MGEGHLGKRYSTFVPLREITEAQVPVEAGEGEIDSNHAAEELVNQIVNVPSDVASDALCRPPAPPSNTDHRLHRPYPHSAKGLWQGFQ